MIDLRTGAPTPVGEVTRRTGLSNSKDLLALSDLLTAHTIDQAGVSTAAHGQVTVSPWRQRTLTTDEIR
ncbi:hypothetical protein ACFWNN_16455 [Lentzea sp. NPDC058450]|uniref:hypothetical protein n=1 Tax=Lentzea sp. NPDC058450 TaxID=3346505 RepID=UPI003661BEC1